MAHQRRAPSCYLSDGSDESDKSDGAISPYSTGRISSRGESWEGCRDGREGAREGELRREGWVSDSSAPSDLSDKTGPDAFV